MDFRILAGNDGKGQSLLCTAWMRKNAYPEGHLSTLKETSQNTANTAGSRERTKKKLVSTVEPLEQVRPESWLLDVVVM